MREEATEEVKKEGGGEEYCHLTASPLNEGQMASRNSTVTYSLISVCNRFLSLRSPESSLSLSGCPLHSLCCLLRVQ